MQHEQIEFDDIAEVLKRAQLRRSADLRKWRSISDRPFPMFRFPGSYFLASVVAGLLVWLMIGPPPPNHAKPILTAQRSGSK